MAETINRMQFLRGDFHGGGDPIRPPWALPELRFVEKCTRCGDCLTSCPRKIITEGRGKYPELDFSAAGCDFCGDCALACRTGALCRAEEAESPPWLIKAAILPNCLSLNAIICRACGEICDERAIRFKLEIGGIARPLLDRDQCTGCGECFAVCPVKAVNISANEPRNQAA
jgi:ferredoxin-type protein NapF